MYKIGLAFKDSGSFEYARKELLSYLRSYCSRVRKSPFDYGTDVVTIDFITSIRNVGNLKDNYDEFILMGEVNYFEGGELFLRFEDLLNKTSDSYKNEFGERTLYRHPIIGKSGFATNMGLVERRISTLYGDKLKTYYKVDYNRFKIKGLSLTKKNIKDRYSSEGAKNQIIFEEKQDAIDALEEFVENKIKSYSKEIQRLQDVLIEENYFDED